MDPYILMLLLEEDATLAAASLLLHMLVFTVGFWYSIPRGRNVSVIEQRLIWNDFERRNLGRGTFRRSLRMNKPSFDKLVALLKEDLTVDFTMAKLRGGPIIPELCLFATVRYFAGASYLDIIDICGISVPSFYRVVSRTARAINRCKQLDFNWPKEPQDTYAAAAGFCSIGTDSSVPNCVGVVDGYLLRIATPRRSEAKNVRSFFSGHHKCYGAVSYTHLTLPTNREV